MAWPTGVTLRTCSLGPDFGIVSGADYGCDIVVSVSRPMMTWGATGSGGIGDQDSLSFTPGLEITFQLPVTDQAGWYIGGLPIDVSDGQQSHVYTLTIKPWIYNSLGRKTFSNATLTLSNLAVPTGADTLDLDKSVATAGAQGGTVTIPDLVGQLQATVETSATDAAASASAAAASAQTAHDISNIDTSDDVVSTLVADPQTGPKTVAALNAAIASAENPRSWWPTPLLEVISDLRNHEPVSVMENIPADQRAGIFAGTSTWDATSSIQELLDDAPSYVHLTMPPAGQITRQNIKIENKDHVRIDGGMCRQVLTGTGSLGAKQGIQLSGYVRNSLLRDMVIVGSGNKDDYHAGIWSASGTEIDHLKVENVSVSSTSIGFSINALSSGTINLVDLVGCTVEDINGIDSGRGYGFHVAFLNSGSGKVRMLYPRAIRCGRHGIYIALVSDYYLLSPMVVGHRSTLTTAEQADAIDGRGKVRPGLLVARSHHGLIRDPWLTGGYDCAFQINANPDNSPGVDCYDHTIDGGRIENPQDGVPLVLMGDPSPSVAGYPEDVTMRGVKFFADYGTLGGVLSAPFIQHNAGKRIRYRDLDMTMKGVNQTTGALTVFNREETAGTVSHSDEVSIRRVSAYMETSNGSICQAVRVDATACASGAHIEIAEVEPMGSSDPVGAVLISAMTNPNLRARNREGSSLGAYAAGDTTPSVARGVTHMVITNSAATSITTLDDGTPGQRVTLRFADLSTTIVNAASGPGFRLNGGTNLASGTRDVVSFICEGGGANSIWYEVAPKSDN